MQLTNQSGQGRVAAEGLFDLAAGVQDRAVVAAPKVSTDLLQRQRCQLTGEVHADLTRQQDVPRPIAGLQLLGTRLELATDRSGRKWSVVESVLQSEEEARAELQTLFSDPAEVEKWLQHMPLRKEPVPA